MNLQMHCSGESVTVAAAEANRKKICMDATQLEKVRNRDRGNASVVHFFCDSKSLGIHFDFLQDSQLRRLSCALLDEEIYLLKQISSLEITSTAAVLLAVAVESSRVFHVVG